jgi:hypothetical protein
MTSMNRRWGFVRNQLAGALLGSLGLGCATTQTDAGRIQPTDRSVTEIRQEAAAAPSGDEPRLDQLHDAVYVSVQGLVAATDQRFASRDGELVPVPAAPFRVGTTLEFLDRSDGVKLRLNAEFDIALRLPNIEKRLGFFITSEELDAAPRAAGADTSVRAGLRYDLLRDVEFDIGVRVDAPPAAFTSVKWQRQVDIGAWNFYPLVKLFADTDESVGYAAAATFDRWSGYNLLRSSSYAKWRNDRDRTEWSQSVIVGRARELLVPDRYGSYVEASDIGRGWGLRLLAGGEDTRAVSHYEAALLLKRPTHSRWLYWHVSPFVRWERRDAWRPDPGIRIGVDALFWDLARN